MDILKFTYSFDVSELISFRWQARSLLLFSCFQTKYLENELFFILVCVIRYFRHFYSLRSDLWKYEKLETTCIYSLSWLKKSKWWECCNFILYFWLLQTKICFSFKWRDFKNVYYKLRSCYRSGGSFKKPITTYFSIFGNKSISALHERK